MKHIKLLLVCLLVTLPALACSLPTPTPTLTPTPTNTPTPTSTPTPTNTPTPTPTPTNTPTPTPTPTPSVIRVEAGGNGHYATLEEAVESAPEGVPIELGAGTFYLEEPLEIRRPITLAGQGMDETEIVSDAEDYVVRFTGDGPFVVEDITFRHEGREAADVVVMRGGEVAFTRCRFTGAVYDEDGDLGGSGLQLEGSTVGVVQACEAEENLLGIAVIDRAEPTLEGNTATDNETYGIVYWDNAGGVARGNDCSWNAAGIGVGWAAQPLLEGNTCTDNEHYGIVYKDRSGGTARHNECFGNDWGGIAVSNQAEPMLEENVCEDNGVIGIYYVDEAGGVARRNECSGNGEAGIIVAYQAEPTLEENVCEDNGVVGIGYADEAGGVARGNECSGNRYGIVVTDAANPELIDNDCHDNIEADVLDER
jgi:parallel beta-helix repeat protein